MPGNSSWLCRVCLHNLPLGGARHHAVACKQGRVRWCRFSLPPSPRLQEKPSLRYQEYSSSVWQGCKPEGAPVYWETLGSVGSRQASPSCGSPSPGWCQRSGVVAMVTNSTDEYGSVTPLHIAAALPVAEGVRITEVLLHAAADPNARAGDGDYIYKQYRVQYNSYSMPTKGLDEKTNPVPGFFKKDFVDSGIVLYSYFTVSSTVPEVGGRTPLHVACEREDNYKFARDVISLLLNHNANTNVLWSGHSPLSLAVASGNDLAIKELLAKGADPNMALGPPVGSVLCAAVSTTYEKQRPVPVRIGLVDKLIKSGANMLMPITIGAGKRTGLGTATDFAYYKYLQDKRIANSPYHTLSADEREIYNERRQLLDHLGKPTRDAVTLKEKEWATEGIVREPALPRHMLARRNKEWLVREESASTPRKDFFKYCCQCGRSLGVKLSACSRCYSVFTCSRLCKKRALDEFHKEECQLYTGYLSSKPSTGRTKRTGEELAVNQNYSFN
ncbi:ankyrin repeat and MYND domain-containing 1-like [Pelobates cultripes]|uniref:Ankyrin repeat and MYND domain-containing 1-like n=1 Tax=Pelobates cultripes TaxID=61616 RepID=A0AAD1RAW0_PELCU|nr:ankyrin repeat and MYND domain-containing 1-like [Pelobates cultripes]